MKRAVIILLIIMAVFLAGCGGDGPPADEPGITGYVMKIDEAGRILVVDPVAQDFSSTGGIEEFYNAIYFSNAPETVYVGDKVRVWFDVVADSYPGQAEAEYVEVIASEKPASAELDEAQALNRALEERGPDAPDTVVRAIEFDAERIIWRVELKELWGEEIVTLEIDDRL